jgi:competence protein ComGD
MDTRNEKGFTLVEMMVVLSIVGIISSITFIHFIPVWKEKQKEQFFELFEKDILYAQIYAMSHERQVNLLFNKDNSTYYVKESGIGQTMLTRTFIKQITIEHLTLPNPITFLRNGNIQRPGKMYVYIYDKKYSVTFQLGKGRFYVTEL